MKKIQEIPPREELLFPELFGYDIVESEPEIEIVSDSVTVSDPISVNAQEFLSDVLKDPVKYVNSVYNSRHLNIFEEGMGRDYMNKMINSIKRPIHDKARKLFEIRYDILLSEIYKIVIPILERLYQEAESAGAGICKKRELPEDVYIMIGDHGTSRRKLTKELGYKFNFPLFRYAKMLSDDKCYNQIYFTVPCFTYLKDNEISINLSDSPILDWEFIEDILGISKRIKIDGYAKNLEAFKNLSEEYQYLFRLLYIERKFREALDLETDEHACWDLKNVLYTLYSLNPEEIEAERDEYLSQVNNMFDQYTADFKTFLSQMADVMSRQANTSVLIAED